MCDTQAWITLSPHTHVLGEKRFGLQHSGKVRSHTHRRACAPWACGNLHTYRGSRLAWSRISQTFRTKGLL